MKMLLLLIASGILPVVANTVSVFSEVYDSSTPVGRHVDFDMTLNLPRFDPTLGSLDSISFTVDLTGKLYWDIQSQTYSYSFLDFGVWGDLSFLGLEVTTRDGPVFGHDNNGACGTADSPQCSKAWSWYNGSGGYAFNGEIRKDGSIFHQHSGMNDFSGALPALDMFVGTDQLLLPIGYSVDSFFEDLPGVKVGNLAGLHQGKASVYLDYHYTPVQVVANPEPRFLIVLAFGALVIFVLQRRIAHVSSR